MSTKRGVFEAELLARLPRLRRFCVALTAATHDADDLLQMTVERLLVKPPPPDADLMKWMFRVCKNIWIDEIRSRKVRIASDIDDVSIPVGGEGDALAHLTLGEVSAAVAALSDDQRSIITLVAVEGYSYKETAEILDLPIGTVMSRLSRARAALADRFDRRDVLH
jgi:RNA polymerase sigma-70 factor (ECF subfamily)